MIGRDNRKEKHLRIVVSSLHTTGSVKKLNPIYRSIQPETLQSISRSGQNARINGLLRHVRFGPFRFTPRMIRPVRTKTFRSTDTHSWKTHAFKFIPTQQLLIGRLPTYYPELTLQSDWKPGSRATKYTQSQTTH